MTTGRSQPDPALAIPAEFHWQPRPDLVSLKAARTVAALAERGIELREGMTLHFRDVEAAELGREAELVSGRVTRWRGRWMLKLDVGLDLDPGVDRQARRRRRPRLLAFLTVVTLVYGSGAVYAAVNGNWFGLYFLAVPVLGLWWLSSSLRFD